MADLEEFRNVGSVHCELSTSEKPINCIIGNKDETSKSFNLKEGFSFVNVHVTSGRVRKEKGEKRYPKAIVIASDINYCKVGEGILYCEGEISGQRLKTLRVF